MHIVKAVIGIILTTAGTAALIWFVRCLSGPRTKTRGFRERPVLFCLLSVSLIIAGTWIEPSNDVLTGVLLGAVIGGMLPR